MHTPPSFWLGDRFRKFAAEHWWAPNEAHNGYLETYLNLGLIGLFLLSALLIATFWKSRRELLRNFQFGRFRLGFLMAVIAYKLDRGSFQEHRCNLVCFLPRRIGLSAA